MMLQVIVMKLALKNLGIKDKQRDRCLMAARNMFIAMNATFQPKGSLRCPYLVSANAI
jgi:hypothetical protein